MVISVLIVVAAIASGIVGPEPATANVTRAKPQRPHVRTITKTVTVHKDGGMLTVTGSGDGGSSGGESNEHEDADRSGHEDGSDESTSDDSSYEDDDAYEQEDEDEDEDDVEASPQPEPTG
jgi:hypothetical protein